MDQSKSNNQRNNESVDVELPKRTLSLEFFVGLFAIVGLACAAYLAVGLGGLEIGNSNETYVYAEFDNISGLKYGAAVEIAGVKIGEVTDIFLEANVCKQPAKRDKAIIILFIFRFIVFPTPGA